MVPLEQAPLQQSNWQADVDSTLPPVLTQETQVPVAVLQTSVPASLRSRQSESALHSTQVPARSALEVFPHTASDGSPGLVQAVPVGSSL